MARPSWNAAVAREPAASLVASHLAPHLTQKPGFKHEQLNRKTFSQLLDIINSQECKTLSLAEGINSICVSLKAGIQPFFELKSLQEKGDLKGQILDCLEIISRVSSMKPEALLAPADPVILGKNVTSSLAEWVVRDVLLLLCSVNDEEINAGVVDLLHCVCLRSSMRTFKILSASLHDLLASLEESEYCSTTPVYFPGKSNSFLDSLDEFGYTRFIFDRISTLEDLAHVVAVCVCIYKATTVALQHMTSLTPARPLSLILQNFNELWDLLLVMIEDLDASAAIEQGLVKGLEILLLELGRTYHGFILESSNEKFACQIMERLLDCCFDLLSCSKLSQNFDLQRSLGQLLYGIQESNAFSDTSGAVLRETLEPDLTQFLAEIESSSSSVEPLLQSFAAQLLGVTDEKTIQAHELLQKTDLPARKRNIDADEEDQSAARKRRRLDSSGFVKTEFIELSAYGLTVDTDGVVRGLNGFADRLEPRLMGESVGAILTEIGHMSCICAGSLEVTRPTERRDISPFCFICDISSPASKHAVWSGPDADELLKAFLKILPVLTDQISPRVTATLTMKKILMHCPQEELLVLQNPPLGEACLQFLRSSIREIRLAATSTVTAFVQKRLKPAIRRDNFMSVLDFLQHMLDSKDMAFKETAILALAQVAKVAGDKEMNIILLRLVEVLGYDNPFLSDVAFSELFSLAEAAEMTPIELFKPFWRTISILAIVNMDSRPKILSQLCELTMMSFEVFLRSSQEYIIPYFVSMKKYDIIELIDPERQLSCMDICKQESNLTSLLAFLLSQPSEDCETLVTSTFKDMSPDTNSHSLSEWVSIQGIEVTCELLRELGESTQENRPTYLRALELVASLKPSRRATSSVNEGSVLALYIEKHILGIIRIFSQAVNENRRSMVEKRRNILAIGEMVRLAPYHVNAALLQICACLRSAFDIVDLCDHALISWDIMIRSLEQEELEPLLDQTYCIIIKYWDSFQEEESRNRGHRLLEWLQSDRKATVQSVYESLPTLDSIPDLRGPEKPAALRPEPSDERKIANFIRRLSNEHAIVVEQALKELLQYLSHTRYWNDSTSSVGQRATDIKIQLTRCLLDCCAKFNEGGYSIPYIAAQCLGILGAVDPNQTEFVRPKKDIVVLSNFDDFDETCNFILFFIQNVLVGAYLSSDAESQGFLAWAMQHFLSLCGFQNADFVPTSQAPNMNNYYQRWFSLPKFVRNLLTPLLSSNYTIEPAVRANCIYPIFSINTSHSTWLRAFVLDMLHKAPKDGNKYSSVFEISSKIIKKRDILIAAFLLPYAALNIFLNGTDDLKNNVISEMLNVLQYPLPDNNNEHRKNAILCSESVFSIMDYCSRWAQARRKGMAHLLMRPTDESEDIYRKRAKQLSSLEATLSQIPAEVLSTRAIECQSFTRALLHWEKHIKRQMGSVTKVVELVPAYRRLQEIYVHINEPDGAEGITADPNLFTIDEQVIETRKGTKWLAAQNWFSSQVAKDPEDSKAQIGLLSCLKDHGQHGVLLSQFDTLQASEKALTTILPMAIDSAWMAGDLTRLSRYLEIASEKHIDDFAVGVGSVLQSLSCGKTEAATQQIESLRHSVAKGLTVNAVSSFKRSHGSVLKLHALSELEVVAKSGKSSTFDDLNQRLTMLGGCINDKCYVLNLRRVAMEILFFNASSVASVWLELARSARKTNNIEEAFNAVTRAVKLGEPQAALEFAKLLWTEGNSRTAIQMLEQTINSNALDSAPHAMPVDSMTVDRPHNSSLISAKAHLLLARWMDTAGQTQSEAIAQKYRYAISLHPRWEKAHYHLGKHYAKILDSEKSKAPDKQSHIFLSGEASKLVVDNFLRSLAYGNKYVFQSLPKILTLWFASAAALDEPYDERSGWSRDFHKHIMAQRLKSLRFINEQVKKYTDRIPTVLFLTILPQLVARVCHPNKDLNAVLRRIIMRTTFSYVQQALWTTLPLLKSLGVDRRKKGKLIFSEIQEAGRRAELSDRSLDITRVLREGQKLSDALVALCSKEAKNRVSEKRTKASLTRDLLFDRSIVRCSLVVPFETNMIPLLPLSHDGAYFAKFRPFPQGPVTFDDISDEVLILRSAQKPRKLNVRGSNGRMYGLLCKPEDLRKDERLMEFNRMINRFLKKDADSSSRQLYIKTYAVTPLNEASGLIEWVNNFRTLKDLIVRLLGDRGIALDWGQIQRDLADTSSEKSKIEAFKNKVLRRYPPVFCEWFLEAFPEPGSWFAARLRYTRTLAVMSMVGHCLGLGDRHGENILFEEANGAVLHVDFNCLFDMGLTLQVPERVPFRLTHNMVDALGVCGYNGPFRRTCEITLSILRQSEDWLVPILETFVHDPTTEFLLAKQRASVKVPSTAQEMLESVQSKLRGLLPGESVPLSVGGQVDELIMQATSIKNLAHMYIGWAPWL